MTRLAQRLQAVVRNRPGCEGWAFKGGVIRPGLRRCVMLMICAAINARALAIGPQPDPIPTGDGEGAVIWSPPQFEGWRIFGVVRHADGHIDVGYDPKHLYQDSTVHGVMRDGRAIAIRYLEIYDELAAGAAAQQAGFRDDRRIRLFPVQEFDAAAGNARVEVWSNGLGNGGFLVVITTKGKGEAP